MQNNVNLFICIHKMPKKFYSKINFIEHVEHNQMLNTMYIWLDGNHQSRKQIKRKSLLDCTNLLKKKHSLINNMAKSWKSL